jgi:hypothetical protein
MNPHPKRYKRTSAEQHFDSHMQALRRGLKAAEQRHGLPSIRVKVSRAHGYGKDSKLVEFVNVESGAVLHSAVLKPRHVFDMRTVIVFLLSGRDGISEEQAAALYDQNEPKQEPKPKREPVRDEDWEPVSKDWKPAVNAANRALENVCKRHALPLHRIKAGLGHKRYTCEIVNAETCEVVPASVIEPGFTLEWEGAHWTRYDSHLKKNRSSSGEVWEPRVFDGQFDVEKIAHNLLLERAKPETDAERKAVHEQYLTDRARWIELRAESMDFNRWKPAPPALETALDAWAKGTRTFGDRLLRMYRLRAVVFYEETSSEDRHELYTARTRPAQLDEFKSFPVEFRKAIYRCYKGGLVLETATLEQLNERHRIRAVNAKQAGGNTYYKRKDRLRKHWKKDTRWDYQAPVKVAMEGGDLTVTPDNKGKQAFDNAERLTDWSSIGNTIIDTTEMVVPSRADAMAKLRELRAQLGRRTKAVA